MKFFDRVKNTVRNNKKATATYTLAAILTLVGSILLKESEQKTHLESIGAGLIGLAMLIAMATFITQKSCPNACLRKSEEQIVLERIDRQKYGAINEEDEESNQRISMCCDTL